jgi:hypothetical protein
MYCFHCGDCCKRMSPISAPLPCLHIIEIDNFVFCGIYNKRPKECKNHNFPASKCPVGISVLRLQSAEDCRIRLDEGYEIIQRDSQYWNKGGDPA